jgi:flavin-dependent dehydrogenase
MKQFQVGIMGGGLAGLTAALDLSLRGYEVVLWEKQNFPHHKVCGEFLSTEIAPYLKQLGAQPPAALAIENLRLSAPSGAITEAKLDMPSWGISRYYLDHFLAQKAQAAGARLHTGVSVEKIAPQKQGFQVHTTEGPYHCQVLLGAMGKRSALERAVRSPESLPPQKTPYLGIKRHYRASIPSDTVQLHNFPGGYAGISAVEGERVNFCYLIDQKQLQHYGGVGGVEARLLPQNPHLAQFLKQAQPLMERPLTISNFTFAPRAPVSQGIPFLGDTAGLIHPFCGNGMAMAIRAAGLASELLDAHWRADKLASFPAAYQAHWRRHFKKRLLFGRRVSPLLGRSGLSEWGLRLIRTSPALLRYGLRQAHGQNFSSYRHGG